MTTERSIPLPTRVVEASSVRRLWPHLALAGIAVLAAVLDFWNLSVNGQGNSYYATAVRSMTQSWYAFRYAAFELGGTWTTVDKPPLAFWIQAASAKLFGFSSWSILGPSAIAGAISVAVLGRTVTRLFGVWAGLIAALVLALTPVALVANRSNNTDAILALTVVLGTWAAVRALQSGRWRWVALTGAFFGLAFLTKMLAAFLVLPGITVAYLLLGPRRLRIRIVQLLAAAAIVTVISLGWMLSVDLTPAADRPHVGSSPNNTELGLAIGWNGLERIFGGSPNSRGAPTGSHDAPDQNHAGDTPSLKDTSCGSVGGHDVCTHVGNGSVPGGGNGDIPAAFGGPSGPTRLLNGMLGAQGSWLLPLALAGLISALVAVGWRRRSVRLAGLIVFGGWMVVVWAIFSFAQGVFHPYYIAELAPGVAAVVGIGTVALWRDVLVGGWRLVFPALAILGTAVFQWNLLRSENAMSAWGWALLAIAVVLALGLVARAVLGGRLRWPPSQALVVATAAAGIGLAALLVTSAAYDWHTTTTPTTGAIPIAEAPGSSPAPIGGFGAAPSDEHGDPGGASGPQPSPGHDLPEVGSGGPGLTPGQEHLGGDS